MRASSALCWHNDESCQQVDESCQQVDESCWWKLSASWCVRLQIFFMTRGEKHIPKVTIAI
jgi:hypothetical protein